MKYLDRNGNEYQDGDTVQFYEKARTCFECGAQKADLGHYACYECSQKLNLPSAKRGHSKIRGVIESYGNFTSEQCCAALEAGLQALLRWPIKPTTQELYAKFNKAAIEYFTKHAPKAKVITDFSLSNETLVDDTFMLGVTQGGIRIAKHYAAHDRVPEFHSVLTELRARVFNSL
jgi:hypothetical protein